MRKVVIDARIAQTEADLVHAPRDFQEGRPVRPRWKCPWVPAHKGTPSALQHHKGLGDNLTLAGSLFPDRRAYRSPTLTRHSSSFVPLVTAPARTSPGARECAASTLSITTKSRSVPRGPTKLVVMSCATTKWTKWLPTATTTPPAGQRRGLHDSAGDQLRGRARVASGRSARRCERGCCTGSEPARPRKVPGTRPDPSWSRRSGDRLTGLPICSQSPTFSSLRARRVQQAVDRRPPGCRGRSTGLPAGPRRWRRWPPGPG